ncbi:Tyrosine-protein kinase receptor Tie-1 [Frankliniella fusca]|uniref:Tyrosine-protein kinase receptor Tie-1 n=1 Tax=Frankliniella fusca TaxID=407009 RepID=A0AAE1LCI2_9NEOP|nr:Tyrosine-protein kinase receptor Tie-1 [Frankliniella fusca]
MGLLLAVVVLVVAAARARVAQASDLSGRLQGDAMQVGELVPVRLNVTGMTGRAVVGFMMCDANACNKVELWGVQLKKMRALVYKNFVDCTTDGWGGTLVGDNVMADSSKVFPASTVFLVTRTSERLLTVRLLDDRTGASATSVALADGMDRLYVKGHYRKDFSPDNVTVEFLAADRGWRRECENGGVLELRPHGEDLCRCAHGFDGPSCETACGPNHYGPRCSQRCAADGAGLGRGCRGIHFNDVKGSKDKVCGSGLHGVLCEQVCDPGTYGPSCTLSCGQCDLDSVGAGQGQGQCDPYTGQCPAGCRAGYHGPTCHRALTHLTVGPDIVNVTETTVSGTFVPSSGNTAGSGPVAFFDVQYREVLAAGAGPGGWVAGVFVRRLASNWSSSPAPPHDFVLDGLRPGVQYDVRVLLLDDELRGLEAAPQVRVATSGRRRVSDVTVFNVTARSASISWSSSAAIAVLVHVECVRSLVCDEDCSQTSKMFIVGEHEKRTTASVEALLPGTTYRVLVSLRDAPGDLPESTTFTTAFTVPEAVPEAVTEGDYDQADKSEAAPGPVTDSGVFSVTNRSATIRWRMPASCLDLNGVSTGTRWQLFLRTVHCPQGCSPPLADRPLSGMTTSTALVLEPLQPGTAYEVRLWLHNTEGYNPDRFLSVRFTTAPGTETRQGPEAPAPEVTSPPAPVAPARVSLEQASSPV